MLSYRIISYMTLPETPTSFLPNIFVNNTSINQWYLFVSTELHVTKEYKAKCSTYNYTLDYKYMHCHGRGGHDDNLPTFFIQIVVNFPLYQDNPTGEHIPPAP